MKVEFYVDKAGKHRWRVTAANNEIVGASTQGFSSRQKAEENLQLLHSQCGKECCKKACQNLDYQKSIETE